MSKYYTPPLSRFLVCALYHEAQAKGIPMTKLANEIVEARLRGTEGWQKAKDQESRLGEGVQPYRTK